MVKELAFHECRNICEDVTFECKSTEELTPLQEIIGQNRAVKALKFGLNIKEKGFNIYVSGMPGTGRKTAIVEFIKHLAKDMPAPPDWCYVNNFKDVNSPRALRLPAGRGVEFKKNIERFISEVREGLKQAFESEEYADKRSQTLEAIEGERNNLTNMIGRTAAESGFQLQQSPIGLVLVPIIDGQPVSEQQLAQLSEDVRNQILVKRKETQDKIGTTFRQLRELERRANEGIKKLNNEVARFVMEPFLANIRELFSDCDGVIQYLSEVEEDILENLFILLQEPQAVQGQFPQAPMPDPTENYMVNLVVDNSHLEGAPVEMEWNPTYPRLFGAIEKEPRFGALITSYMMIRAGAAHRANGGFLVVPIERLAVDPIVWESLKQTISNESLEIEEPAQRFGYMVTKTLRPEAIPFEAKVIILGDPMIYSILYAQDKDFKKLFKVKAEFDTTMDRNEENIMRYASFICTLCEKENLYHMDPTGLSAIIEYSSRMVSDKEKLSTQFSEVADIVREANFYAKEEGDQLITKKHIDRQLEEKVYRSNLIQEKMQEMVERGSILVDTEGEKVGQVNGLAVLGLGDYAFGKPSRITASISVGRKGIVDIEREAEMGGPTHTKGVLILSGFLSDRYAREKPLSLTARLVFEQSYSGVDGDSASSTELYSLLSALSGKPIKQNFAVTGSVNQKGEVQAIGGVNQKIEGFFELCKARGLTGEQGCLIPHSNVQNLMLKQEVLDAVKEGKFHIWPISTIDEGIEVLTGVSAGERKPDGSWEEGTINQLVQERLNQLAETIKGFKS
ncbi:MAG: AAA family ATPase [Methanomassiliicoccales archaeon]|nr:AAA family ATPase [Methanomassiliicoccales archaeon]